MLKIDRKPQFWADVTPPDFDQEDRSFKARFRVVGKAEMDGFDLESPDGTAAFLKAAIVNVDDVVTDGDEPLSLPALRDALLDDPTIRIALVRAYFEGLAKAREGN